MFLGLITRCKDEPYIEEFCNYYISQGVDKIFILDDDSKDKGIYKNLLKKKKIVIFFCKNIFRNKDGQMYHVNLIYNKIKINFTWMISVDVDEYIATIKNNNKTIREELNTTFKNVDCIKIPWVMMASNKREESPQSLLNENTFRWNHDKKHPNNSHKKFRCRYDKIEVKCIFRTNKFREIGIHIPNNPINNNNIIIDSIYLKKSNLNPFYDNLREIDIKEAYFVCYHYRIISLEHSKNKLKSSNLYKNRKINLENLYSSDYSEKEDLTMKNKITKENYKNHFLQLS